MPTPRGVLLMGISGCGKSLAVKIIAREWALPLFRLDMNLVFAGVHGSAEWVFHRALEAVEAVAPAVLWIDEIEMGIAGYAEGQTGSNTRIFSTFLTWMQEHRADVFVAATANRIHLLPAEILRKGRFDQVFFVDLPNEEERKEILAIHMDRNQIDSSTYDLILLSSATRAWNGAEIEQAVASARITAHAQDKEAGQNDLLAAFGKTIPAVAHHGRAAQADPFVGPHPRPPGHQPGQTGDLGIRWPQTATTLDGRSRVVGQPDRPRPAQSHLCRHGPNRSSSAPRARPRGRDQDRRVAPRPAPTAVHEHRRDAPLRPARSDLRPKTISVAEVLSSLVTRYSNGDRQEPAEVSVDPVEPGLTGAMGSQRRGHHPRALARQRGPAHRGAARDPNLGRRRPETAP